MDALNLLSSAVYFVGAQVFRKATDELGDVVWARFKEVFLKVVRREPVPQVVTESTVQQAISESSSLRTQLEAVLGRSSALRRAQVVGQVLQGASMLWVDDHPENNAWERGLFQSLGVNILAVETTRSALASLRSEPFDIVISDIARDEDPMAGIDGLSEVLAAAPDLPVIFYVGQLSASAPPAGARGITNEPNELLHLVLDQLERRRL